MNELEDELRLDRQVLDQVVALESVRPGLLTHLIGIFQSHFDEAMRKMNTQLQQGEYEQARTAFHSLKGAAASLGATRLSKMAGVAEILARTGEDLAAMTAITDAIQVEYAAVNVALQTEASPL